MGTDRNTQRDYAGPTTRRGAREVALVVPMILIASVALVAGLGWQRLQAMRLETARECAVHDARALLARAIPDALQAGETDRALRLTGHAIDVLRAAERSDRQALLCHAYRLRARIRILDAAPAGSEASDTPNGSRGGIVDAKGTAALERALADLALARRVDPECALTYADTGRVLERLGRLEAAQGAYAEALRRNPNLASVQMRQARVLEALGQTEEAAAARREAARLGAPLPTTPPSADPKISTTPARAPHPGA